MEFQVILNLILNYFLNINLNYLNVINCWNLQDRFTFINVTRTELMFVRFINIHSNDYEMLINKLCTHGSMPRDGFVFDYSCVNASKILEQLSLSQCFTMNRFWLIYETTTKKAIEHLDDTNLSVDAHITYANPVEPFSVNSSVFQLFDVYNNGKKLGGSLNVTYAQTVNCSSETRLIGYTPCRVIDKSNFSSLSFYKNRNSLADITMKIGAVVVGTDINQSEAIIIEHFNSKNNTHINNISRYGYRLGLLIRDILGYNIKWIYRNIWTKNYTSGGLLEDIEVARVDQTTTPFIMDKPRLSNVQIVFIAGNTRTAFLFLTPDIADLSGSRYTKPFSCGVWFCIILTLGVFSVGLRNVFALERRLKANKPFTPSYVSTIVISIGMLCQQSSFLVPSTGGGRISYVLLLIACFVLYNHYTSLIVAFLLGSPVKSDIKTLRQVADSDLNIGLHDVPYTRTYVNYTIPDIMYFNRKKLPSAKWMSPQQGIQKAREPGFAYHCDVTIGYIFVEKYYSLNEICDLNEVDLLSQKLIGFPIQKGSPYFDILRTKHLWLLETGLVSKHHRYWFKQKPPCMAQNVIASVSMGYAAPVFLVLLIGFGVSLIILMVEIFWNCYKQEMKKSHNEQK